MNKPDSRPDIPSRVRSNLPKIPNLWGLVTAYGLQITAAAVAILTIVQGATSAEAALAALVAMLGEDVVKKRFADMLDRLRGEKKGAAPVSPEEIASRVAAALSEDKADLSALLEQTQAAVILLQEAVAQGRADILAAVVDSREAILDAIWATHRELMEAIANLRSARLPPTLRTLATPVADFTGRGADIAELIAALKPDGRCDSALISGLRGMGGIGKTELARKVGHLLAVYYPDAQLEVSCQIADVPRTPEQLLAAVVSAFFPEAKLPDARDELQARYRSALADKRGFLLLDNAASGDQVSPLLPPPAGWAVVVTSRWRFALPGACLDKNLDVLNEDDARDLIRRILKAGRREAADEQVTEMAYLCGRLPLALRVAASFLVVNRDWPVEEYIKALKEARLRYLDVEGEGSVEASLGLSVRQLERDAPELAARWRLLGIFPAPFDRPAAAAVWELPDDEVRDTLSELCRWSLVEYDEEKGAYALHDLLREYALREGADAALRAKWDAARSRHAAHYLTVGSAADDMYKSDAVEGLRRFDAALPHLRAAWTWMRAQGDDAAARWLSDCPSRMPYVLDLRMPPGEQMPVLEAALDAARRLGDRQDEGVHLGNLGNAYAALGDPKRAIEFYQQALEMHRQIGDRRGEGNALGNLGAAYAALGDPKRAIEFYQQHLAIARQIGDRRGEGNALGNLGLAYAALGDPKRAIEFYQQHLAIARQIGDRRGEAIASWNMGLLLEKQGDYARAAELMQICVDYERAIGHPDAEKHAEHLARVRAKAR